MSLYIMDSFDLYNDIIDKHMGVIWKATENAINAESEWISATEATATVDNNNTPKTTKSKGGSKAKTETPIDNESVRHAEAVVKASGSDVTKDPNAKPETKTEKDAKESKDNANMSIIDAIGNLLSEVGKMIVDFFKMLGEKISNIVANIGVWKKDIIVIRKNDPHAVKIKSYYYQKGQAMIPIVALGKYITTTLKVLIGALRSADLDKIENLNMDGLRLADMLKMSDAQIQAKIFSKISIKGEVATSYKDFESKVLKLFYDEEKYRTFDSSPAQIEAWEKKSTELTDLIKMKGDRLGIQSAKKECDAAYTALSTKVQNSKYDMSGPSLSQRMASVNKGYERVTKLINMGLSLEKLELKIHTEFLAFSRRVLQLFYAQQKVNSNQEAQDSNEATTK